MAGKATRKLTRKEFYDIAQQCREQALDLARHDQSRVSVAHCRDFNRWLRGLKEYQELAGPLQDLTPARPITRWHMMGISLALWFLLQFFLLRGLGEMGAQILGFGLVLLVLLLVFLPESLYGTTVELLEAKLLRVVETLEGLLFSGEMGFSEAVFFQVKENLRAAREELRQQIDLAHRP